MVYTSLPVSIFAVYSDEDTVCGASRKEVAMSLSRETQAELDHSCVVWHYDDRTAS